MDVLGSPFVYIHSMMLCLYAQVLSISTHKTSNSLCPIAIATSTQQQCWVMGS